MDTTTPPPSISSPLVPGFEPSTNGEELPVAEQAKEEEKGEPAQQAAAAVPVDILFGAGDTITTRRVGEPPGPIYLGVLKDQGFDPKKHHKKVHVDFDREWDGLVVRLRELIVPDPKDVQIRAELEKARWPVYQPWQYTTPMLPPLALPQDTGTHDDDDLPESEGSSAQDEAGPDTAVR